MGALIRGYSPNTASAKLVANFWMLAAIVGAIIWIEWVPGPANLADDPSRLDFDLVRGLGIQVEPLAKGFWELLL